MGILEDIKQKKSIDEEQLAHLNILYTANWLNDSSRHIFKKYGVSLQQYNVMRILKGAHPNTITPGEIKEVMLDKSPDVTRLLDKLLLREFVSREVCPSNRRKLDVSITQCGIGFLKEITEELDELSMRQRKLSEEEAKELNRILDKLRG